MIVSFWEAVFHIVCAESDGFILKFRNSPNTRCLLLTFDSQLPRERRRGDAAHRRTTTRQNPAEVGPAPGGDARDGQLQFRDAGREGVLVRRRGSDRQPDLPHQQGAPGQDPPGVRTFLPGGGG